MRGIHLNRFRLSLIVCLLCSMLLSLYHPEVSSAAPGTESSVWSQIIALPVGTGPGQVSYNMYVEGASPRGPQAFSVAPDGKIYLLDSLQRRVHVITGGHVEATLVLPFTSYPRDILALDTSFYLLDDTNQVFQISAQGQLLRTYSLPEGLATHQVYRMEAKPNGRVVLWTPGYEEFALDQPPAKINVEAALNSKPKSERGVAAPDGERWLGEMEAPDLGRMTTNSGKTVIHPRIQSTFGAVRLLGFDRQASLYMIVEDLYNNAERLGVEQTIQRYTPAGRFGGMARIPLEVFAIIPRRAADVTADGTIYAMVPARAETRIYRVTLGRNEPSRAHNVAAPPDDADLSQAQTSTSNGNAPFAPSAVTATLTTRKAIHQRANSMTTTSWTWKTRYDKFPSGAGRGTATKPSHLPSTEGTAVVGIPYTWGGFDSLWTHSDNAVWTTWGTALSYYTTNGPLVGNTNGTGYYVGGTAGIDCSGYVAAAANYFGADGKKPGTSTLQSAGFAWSVLTKGGGNQELLTLQPMNFFVSGFHTFYVLGVLPDATQLSTLEATTDQSPQGAKRFTRQWTELPDYPYYRSWFASTAGDEPRNALTTTGAGSACFGMVGQNVWYKFTTTTARTITLTGISGGNPDLYLYKYDSANGYTKIVASTSTGNESVTASSAGTYYVRIYIKAAGSPCTYWTISW